MKWSVIFIVLLGASLSLLCLYLFIQSSLGTVNNIVLPSHNIIQKNADVIQRQSELSFLRHLQAQVAGNKTLRNMTSDGLQFKHSALGEGQLPLLTLFTTLRDLEHRIQTHTNVIRNWAMFQPYIIPVLFAQDTNPRLIYLAKSLGWTILPVTHSNSFGTPYLKPMYSEVKQRFKSVFYGYCNGDLLFEFGLVDTLKTVAHCLHKLGNTMIVGQRTNFNLNNRDIFKPADIAHIGQTEGELFRVDAEDYFFIANNDFAWHRVPDIVVGRPAYDNFLVGIALLNRISVVDATKTLLALHQTGVDGNFAGHHKSNDTGHNNKVIGRFNYGIGVTKNAQYETVYNSNDQVEVWHRIQKTYPERFKIEPKYYVNSKPLEASTVNNVKPTIHESITKQTSSQNTVIPTILVSGKVTVNDSITKQLDITNGSIIQDQLENTTSQVFPISNITDVQLKGLMKSLQNA